jgi:hypothetical protein
MRRNMLLPLIMLTILLSACQAAPAATAMPTAVPPVDTLAPTPTPPTPSLTASPTNSPAPTATPTSTVTPTSTPFVPFDAVTTAAAVNLRAGPGYLFPALRSLKKGGTVAVLGKAPGGEWIRVRTPEAIEGWVFWRLLRSNVSVEEAPVVEPQNVQRIQGRVVDGSGTPIQGVAFDVFQGVQTVIGNDPVLTDSKGGFFAFLPLSSHGIWTVKDSGIACESNVWADASCTNYKNGYLGKVDPLSADVTLPYTGVLEFIWS